MTWLHMAHVGVSVLCVNHWVSLEIGANNVPVPHSLIVVVVLYAAGSRAPPANHRLASSKLKKIKIKYIKYCIVVMAASQEDREELLLSCRYGELQNVQGFVTRHGAPALADARDDHGNTVLHMTCANGHVGEWLLSHPPLCTRLRNGRKALLDILEYLFSLVPTSLLAQQNHAGSTPLHWAALNRHLQIAQKLIQHPGGPGVDLIDIKNAAGRSPLGEAEMAEWDEGAQWFAQVMNIDEVKKEESDGQIDSYQSVDIEIQNVEGQIAPLTINNATQALSTSLMESHENQESR
ncbi:hypothetical protein F5J12DRAFT_406813 [Pisolithus orientalis]|uniref:uncharacterized protein n=1 Tax=Pisolithus orientalis TaxID=936130 RepID=UPI002225AAD0|nr:uncharacterized protein F5J12DRAFT_406813 [Pisolithus orientalis]KAI5995350.1 hypothetical protein F5J12DRAFT_406813 [Pisolithus orientalis]